MSDSHSENYNSQDSGDSSTTVENIVIPKGMHEDVIKFVKIGDIVREKEEELKELKKQKRPLEKKIIDHMKNMKQDKIEITSGKLIINRSETKASLKKDMIKVAIFNEIGDNEKVEKILEKMESMREPVVHTNLKRTANRSGRKNKN